MKRNKWILVVSLLLGLGAAATMFFYTSKVETGGQQMVLADTLVATRDILAGQRIDGDDVAVRQVPLDFVHPQALAEPEEATGRWVKETIHAGEPVLETRLFSKSDRPGIEYSLTDGKRAVTVSVNEVSGVAGFIKPGDYVDVLGTFDDRTLAQDATIPVLERVKVLAVAQDFESSEDRKPKVTTTVTLAVTLEEAAKLTFAEERGSVRLVLRRDDDLQNQRVPAATASRIAGHYTSNATEVIPPKPVSEKTSEKQGTLPNGTSSNGDRQNAAEPAVGTPAPAQAQANSRFASGAEPATRAEMVEVTRVPSSQTSKVVEIIKGSDRSYVSVPRTGGRTIAN